MSKTNTYVPSDLEQLLLTKEYDELTPQELELTTEYAANAVEYAEMKVALTSIVAHTDTGDIIAPKTSTKNTLMDQFANTHSKPAAAWFSFSNITFRYALTGLATIFILTIYFWPKPSYNSSSETASLKPVKVKERSEEISTTDIAPESNSSTENKVGNAIDSSTNGTYTVSVSDASLADTSKTYSWSATNDQGSNDTLSDQIYLNIAQSNSLNSNSYTTSNHLNNRYAINSADTVGIRFNGIQSNSNFANFAQTRDYNNTTESQNAFGSVVEPVQEPQSLGRNIDLLDLLHTATEK